jgi:protein-tyrosine phosphatase
MGFCDLHSHVLPGLDDGARDLAESIELLGALGAMGFDLVCATPHQKAGSFLPTREAIDAAFAAVSRALAERGEAVLLGLGAENFWDEVFLDRVSRDGASLPTFNGGPAFLFELPVHLTPPRLENLLFELRLRGRLPVMAHPERYQPLWDDLDRYRALARTAALVVDLGALDGAHGRRQGQIARTLVEEGIAHACASDVHSITDARAAAGGLAWVRKRCGEAAVTRLLDEGPRRILNGELPD